MYVALVTSEERAVETGPEHEETAVPESRYESKGTSQHSVETVPPRHSHYWA
jgi:hypothetical protein